MPTNAADLLQRHIQTLVDDPAQWDTLIADDNHIYLHPAKPEYAWVKAGIIHQVEIVKPTYENWVKDKVKWSVINVSKSNEEGRKA